jgi:hypothetical protein
MKSLADNRLYARDHNIDHVSTFKKGKKERRKRRKKKRKSKEGKSRQPPVVPSCAQIMG